MQGLSAAASTSSDAPRDAEHSQSLRDQETGLVKLGELYRDQKFVCSLNRNSAYLSNTEQECRRPSTGHNIIEIIHVIHGESQDGQT